jgi:hypothetical protein
MVTDGVLGIGKEVYFKYKLDKDNPKKQDHGNHSQNTDDRIYG